MRKALFFAVMALFLVHHQPSAEGAKKTVVLLPVQAPFSDGEKGQLAKKLSESLSENFTLLWGKEVDSYVSKVFGEENKKADCDLATCYNKIAIHFNTEMLASLYLVKTGKKDFKAVFKMANVLEGKETFSKTVDCADCDLQKLTSIVAEISSPAGKAHK